MAFDKKSFVCWLCACFIGVSATAAATTVTAEEERLAGADGSESVYRTKRCYWDGSRLTSTALEDAAGTTLFCRTYKYDARGRCIEERLHGDLSGHAHAPLLLDDDGHPADNGVESYATHYEYDPLSGRLLGTYDDQGRGEVFIHDDTGAMIAKMSVAGGAIADRTRYSYDDDGALYETIIDDGDSYNLDDLDGVNERHRTTISYDEGVNRIEHWYLDQEQGGEQQLYAQEVVSTPTGDLEMLCCYDANNSYSYGVHTQYGTDGQPEARIDSRGKYELFDFSEVANAASRVTRDQLGRVVATALPTVTGKDGEVVTPYVTRTYDAADRVIEQTDAAGDTTRFSYNARGQVCGIEHPDGTTEAAVYNIDGTIDTLFDRQGRETRYRHDSRGRIIHEQLFGNDGKLFSERSRSYRGAQLVEETDSDGTLKQYEYDGAGRLMAVARNNQPHQELEYDARGLLWRVREFSSPDCWHWRIFERNGDDEVQAIRTENPSGRVLSRELTDPQSATEQEIVAEEWTEGDSGEQIRITVSTTPAGALATRTYDEAGDLVDEEITDNNGIPLSHTTFAYDAMGRKVWERELITASGNAQTNSWQYGPGGRLESITEGDDAGINATTRYNYNEYGQLTVVTKAGGTTINYSYDPAGRVATMTSSDHSIDYTFHYDSAGRIDGVIDGVFARSNTLSYAGMGRIAHEQLGNGLELSSDYDLLGRREQLTLPDGSAVVYSYQGTHLNVISRLDESGDELYQHQYSSYDSSGKVTEAQMIGSAGALSHMWEEGLLTGIDTRTWAASMPLEAYDPAGMLRQMLINDSLGAVDLYYDYDGAGRLVAERGATDHYYQYDALGNRMGIDGKSLQVNEINQLVFDGTHLYSYDPNGNMVARSSSEGTIQYRYDALDRLVRVERAGDWAVAYTYDAFHRRLDQIEMDWTSSRWNVVDTQRFLYDGSNEIGTFDENGTAIDFRVLGIGQGAEIGASVALELNSTPFAPVHDKHGSIACLVDAETGLPRELYRYSAFGEEEIYDFDGIQHAGSPLNNPWRYQGKRIDDKTGLVYFGQRYYDPATGRWLTKDPIGFGDGPNRYAYLHNDPINYTDPYGLFSLSDAWYSVTDATRGFFSSLYNGCMNVGNYLSTQLHYIGGQKSDLEDLATAILGKGNFFMSGYYAEDACSGMYGYGEVHDSVRITYLNGIMTSLNECVGTAAVLSDTHGRTNVHYVYRPTAGWTWDVSQSVLVKTAGILTTQAYMLSEKWKALIGEMGPDDDESLIIHYAHSIGGSESLCAKKLMTRKERQKIRLITFGSATLVPQEEDFESVTNYVSIRDGVPFFDPIGYLRSLIDEDHNVVFLGSHADGPPMVDHLIAGDTYRSIIESLGREFVQIYGAIKEQVEEDLKDLAV